MATEAGRLIKQRFTQLREKTGAPVVADIAQDSGHLLNALGYETVLVVPVLTGGAGPTAELTPYLYDEDRDTYYPHTSSGLLSSGQVIEVAPMGFRLFVGISAVNGAPTKIEILVAPGRRSRLTEE